MYVFYNPNPSRKLVGDCVIRAIAKMTGKDWETTYLDICVHGLMLHDMPSANYVWGSYLNSLGFKKTTIPDTCPDCYTVEDFCNDHPQGVYMLATGSHVIAVEDGNYFDSWDSGNEVPVYFYTKEEK